MNQTTEQQQQQSINSWSSPSSSSSYNNHQSSTSLLLNNNKLITQSPTMSNNPISILPFNNQNDNESIITNYSDHQRKIINKNIINGNATATYASLLTTVVNHQNNNSQLNLIQSTTTATTPTTITTASIINNYSTNSINTTPNIVINPYHGNYQSIINNNQDNGQVQSVVSIRSNGGKQSTSSYHNRIIKNNIDSIYPNNNQDNDIVQQQQSISILTPEDWNDNTTAITVNTSDQSGGSLDDLSKIENFNTNSTNYNVSNCKIKNLHNTTNNNIIISNIKLLSNTIITILLSSCAFLSPILMIIIPKLELFDLKIKKCGPECDGLIISLIFKLLILFIGNWLIFFRRSRRSRLPRICTYRLIVIIMIVILLISYWLFYIVKIIDKKIISTTTTTSSSSLSSSSSSLSTTTIIINDDDDEIINYYSIILFAISLIDVLLFIHYLTIILLICSCCHLENEYFIKVVRSPDGYSKCYTIGRTSIQRASLWIIDRYYQDFPRYNSFIERLAMRKHQRKNSHLSSTSSTKHGLKFYDVDGIVGNNGSNNQNNSNDPLQLSPKSLLAQNTAANAGRKHWPKTLNSSQLNGIINTNRNQERLDVASHHSGHSGRHRNHNRNNNNNHNHNHYRNLIHEQHEYERRIRKRKSRLINVTEEAFTHIKRVQQQNSLSTTPSSSMNAKEAAQAIFPTIARTLQKYLRATRQQTNHTVQSILEHMTICLTYDLSPKTFLEKYLSPNNLYLNWTKNNNNYQDQDQNNPNNDNRSIETWNLISDTLVSRSIENNCQFLLRQQQNDNICLLITITNMPNLNLIEQFIDNDNVKFLFKLNSETSV